MRLGKRWGSNRDTKDTSGEEAGRSVSPAVSGNGGSSEGEQRRSSSPTRIAASAASSSSGGRRSLWKNIERGDWDAVRTVLATRKGHAEARKVAFTGQSVLTQAIDLHKGNIPAHVVRWLVEAAPQALSEPDLWGHVPLHVVCDKECSYDVFCAVLEMGSPMATLTKCKEGRTPLHYAVARACSLSDILASADVLGTCDSSSARATDDIQPIGKPAPPADFPSSVGDDGPTDMDAVTIGGTSRSHPANVTASTVSGEEGKRMMREVVDVIVCLAFSSPKAILVEDSYGETPWDVVITWIETKTIESDADSVDAHCIVLQDHIRRILRHAIAWNTREGEDEDEEEEEPPKKQRDKSAPGSSSPKKKGAASPPEEASSGRGRAPMQEEAPEEVPEEATVVMSVDSGT